MPRAGWPTRRALLPAGLGALALALTPSYGFGQGSARQAPKGAPVADDAPRLSAPRSIMAGSIVTVFVSHMPAGVTLAIARPDDPPERAIAMMLSGPGTPLLPAPGLVGTYELRLLRQQDGKPVVLLRQPLATTEPSATLAAPDSVKAGATFPARGIGPNGQLDEIMIVEAGAPADAQGPRFFPAQNVESTLEAPTRPGTYELRYVMHAPLSGRVMLARKALAVR